MATIETTGSKKLPPSADVSGPPTVPAKTAKAKKKKQANKATNKAAGGKPTPEAATPAGDVESSAQTGATKKPPHAESVAVTAVDDRLQTVAEAPQSNGHAPTSDTPTSSASDRSHTVATVVTPPSEPSTSIGAAVEPVPATTSSTTAAEAPTDDGAALTADAITYVIYENELQMPDIMRLIQKDLSEPYSIYTYRYFIHNWPKLCYLAMHGPKCVGAIVCKLDVHRQSTKRGYIAMLAVDKDYRKLKIGTTLVQNAITAMLTYSADEVVLETEITNTPALRLYENLGFVRDKRLFGYYLNGVDALRLKLWFR